MRFLFIDRILEVEAGRRILASKHVTMADGYLVGDHEGRPSMPASILLESLAQTGGDLNLLTRGEDVQTFLMLVEGLRIRRLPHPGEAMLMEVQMGRGHSAGATVEGEARVGDEVIATLDRMLYVHRRTEDASYIRRQRLRMRALLASLPVPVVPDSARPAPNGVGHLV
jgi:3-hydroxyacyl-[acyl-carrier-protein] dehydratase